MQGQLLDFLIFDRRGSSSAGMSLINECLPDRFSCFGIEVGVVDGEMDTAWIVGVMSNKSTGEFY